MIPLKYVSDAVKRGALCEVIPSRQFFQGHCYGNSIVYSFRHNFCFSFSFQYIQNQLNSKLILRFRSLSSQFSHCEFNLVNNIYFISPCHCLLCRRINDYRKVLVIDLFNNKYYSINTDTLQKLMFWNIIGHEQGVVNVPFTQTMKSFFSEGFFKYVKSNMH